MSEQPEMNIGPPADIETVIEARDPVVMLVACDACDGDGCSVCANQPGPAGLIET